MNINLLWKPSRFLSFPILPSFPLSSHPLSLPSLPFFMPPPPSHSPLVISIKVNDTICSADPARNLGVLLDTWSLSHSTFKLHRFLLTLSSRYVSICQLFPISFTPSTPHPSTTSISKRDCKNLPQNHSLHNRERYMYFKIRPPCLLLHTHTLKVL